MNAPLGQPGSGQRAQQREHAEPSEQLQPIPLVVAIITLAMVLFGAGYLLLSESFGRPELGDRRTLTDLSVSSSRPAQGGGKADGRLLFTANCVACHQTSGQGVPGVFPPLAGSEWVKGSTNVLANILLHGISGEINVAGQSYKGVMPAFGHFDNADIAALASYIRREWGNGAAGMEANEVEAARKSGARTTPFSGGAELKSLADRTANAAQK